MDKKEVNVNGEKLFEADDFKGTILIRVMHFMLIHGQVPSHSVHGHDLIGI